eukprot:TRINITY_DN7799_c0_g1_i1.p1 TRINITY_DN7799_c0_g1~~TRINITY_DN7799_c0_g1_i1.p1  ORF type:complete len:206 (+),score=9.94 TRINITY_DN7799_c0_g1_i1:114-731(+)
MLNAKIVFGGDGAVGKSSSITTLSTGEFPHESVPFVCELTTLRWTSSSDKAVEATLWDLGGGEDYSVLRPLSYPGATVFVLAFSVVCHSSFEHLASLWIPEVRQHLPDVAIVLVGTKIDLRTDAATVEILSEHNQVPISREEAEELVEKFDLAAYCEFSALTQEGLPEFRDLLANKCVDVLGQSGKKKIGFGSKVMNFLGFGREN